MTRTADHAAVYAAELAAFDGTDLEEIRPFSELASMAERVTTDDWWPGRKVRVMASRVDARSSTCSVDGDGDIATVRLAGGQMTVATVAHELAHAVVGPAAGHGALYRAALLDVIAVVTNLDSTDRRGELHVAQLTAAFADHALTIAPRSWAAPSSAGPVAL